jgi:hypothetical protein
MAAAEASRRITEEREVLLTAAKQPVQQSPQWLLEGYS